MPPIGLGVQLGLGGGKSATSSGGGGGLLVPVITSSAATNIVSNGATLNGTLVSTGGDDPSVTVYWGTTDRGETAAGWNGGNYAFGTQSAGALAYTASGMSHTTTFYYRFKAVNSAGTAWTGAQSFQTLAVWSNTLSGLFDGGDNLDTSAITLTGAKAISLWAKCSANWISGNGPKLFGSSVSADWFPHVAYGQYLYAKGTNNAGTPNSSQHQALGAGFYVLNNWYHFVITSDGTTMTYYANNATVGGTAAAARGTDINVNPQSLDVIGGTALGFQGSNMDEVAIWDVELSAAQVTNIYRGEENGGSGGTDGTPGDLATFNAASGTGPLHWWRFGDGTGDVNASGGAPADAGVIGTVVDQGSGGKNATQTTVSEQPTFSNVLP